jgi:glutamate--cysteine ligase catalytic subunit
VIKQTKDERSREELGEEPLKNDRFRITKSRFDTTELYLSSEGQSYNDIEYQMDEEAFKLFMDNEVPEPVARHFANLLIRDPLMLFEENLTRTDEDYVDNFELVQNTCWRLLRFKPPPVKSEENNQIGWRCEFRPIELQLTDFENCAFAAMIVLMARFLAAVGSEHVSFLLPLSLVAENVQRANKANACAAEKFYFRENVNEPHAQAHVAEMSMNEIFNGDSSRQYKGIIPMLQEFVSSLQDVSDSVKQRLSDYMKLFELRANGTLLTPAAWIRKFVREHPSYKHDSVIDDEVAYDLMVKLNEISTGKCEAVDLVPNYLRYRSN